MKKLLLASLFALTACATAPLSNQIEAASLTVHNLAMQIDRLQKAKAITNAQEDAWMDRLLDVNHKLRLASALADGCKTECSNATDLLAAANALLIQLQAEVPHADQ